jgi:hypothetical protein
MKQIWTILLVLAFAQASFGQAPDSLWTRTFGGAGEDACYSMQQTTDGGYILAGYTSSFGSNAWLVKTDENGDSIWSQTYSGDFRSVQQTLDGGYVLAGVRSLAGNCDFLLTKTDANGNQIWSRTFGGSGYDDCYSVQQTSDGGFILAGHTKSFGAGRNDFWMVKTNLNGDSLWSRTFGGTWEEVCYSVQQTTDGGYMLAGYTRSFGWACPNLWLVKTDENGDSVWSRTFGGSSNNDDECFSAQQTSDGGYILAGYTKTGYYGWMLDVWLVKTDSNGNLVWDRTFGASSYDNCYSVQQTSDGGYILGGTTQSFGAGSEDFWLVKTDSNGNSLWSRTFGGSGQEICYSVKETSDGGYILAGYASSFGAGSGDFWLVKTGPEYPNVGYATLVSPGPPDWGYRLHWVSGALSRLVFTNFCSGTVGSVSGAAAAAGWMATNYADSVVFSSDTWLSSGSVETFWLSHPYCSDVVTWTAGDSSGSIEGPLPVELTTFQAFAGDGQVTLCWRTESELDNSHFVLYKRKAGEDKFNRLVEIPGHGTTTEPHDYEYVDRFVRNGITYEYQISDVDIAGRETIHEQIASATPGATVVPTEFALYAPYPNPFNPTTTIRYDVKETGLVSFKVFDLLGREVALLVHGTVPAGSYSVEWNAGDLPSGVYLCRMEAERFQQTRKVVLLK